MRDRRHRPDQAQEAPRRRVDAGSGARGRAARPRRRRADLDRHRRRRDRQGPRPVRGRDDARAVHGRRAGRERASRCCACTPPGSVGGSTAHRRVAPHRDRSSRPRADRRVREADRGQRPVGPRRRPQRRHGRRRDLRPVDARPSASGRARPSTSAGRSRSRTGATRRRTRTRTCRCPTSRSRRSRSPRCCGTRSTSSSRARPPTARARSCSPNEEGAKRASKPPAWVLGDGDAQRARHVPGPRPGAAPGRRGVRARRRTTPAGITNPREQIDVAELYVPFSWYEPMWLEGHDIVSPGRGVEDDRRRRDQPRRRASR